MTKMPTNSVAFQSLANGLIGYIISNFLLKRDKLKENFSKKITEKKEKKYKKDLDMD